MKKIKGPAIFLAQFAGDDEPFNNLKNISSWASKLGYKGAVSYTHLTLPTILLV